MTAQEEFDQVYITSSEICGAMAITRATLMNARQRGLLPDPININNGQLTLWKRETVQPYLDAWKLILKVRRSRNV